MKTSKMLGRMPLGRIPMGLWYVGHISPPLPKQGKNSADVLTPRLHQYVFLTYYNDENIMKNNIRFNARFRPMAFVSTNDTDLKVIKKNDTFI